MMDLSKFSNEGFERGAERWMEAAWLVTKRVFFQTSVPWPSTLRSILLRWFGAQVGKGVVIRANVNISFPWRLVLGDYVWLGEEVMILSLAPVTIGSHVCVSQRSFLCTGSHDHRKETFDLIVRGITLGNGCWVAAQSFIGPGVEVGSGSVISAGSVVMNSVPECSLVRGNPGVVIKTLAVDSDASPAESGMMNE
ncbi:MAG: WcaF family extracellular polysaccharide biosynthesis acetyltransferase [Prosthecobacter sp.]|uniref:WcaF family extracellular polysaccharide biosynthesis acetyltransferase n=1 Tax=Prosthecobacter sp. TaxID=1965333 RepID=UPI0025F9B49B|nr:WcaF family extracellular polysaccharide biosynthesis acetyltransferase [Prosthecobacter sp.]MCF7785927.1 WcaF family extracellular polysaccharide biosynthesis acetyltransferase [Prosthecobacter sp.]